MNIQNFKNNTGNHVNDLRKLLSKHEAICEQVNSAAVHIIDSVNSLNEKEYSKNLLLLTSYLDELVKLNDGFTISSMLNKSVTS